MLCTISLNVLIHLEEEGLIVKNYGMHKDLAEREMRSACSQRGGVGLAKLLVEFLKNQHQSSVFPSAQKFRAP